MKSHPRKIYFAVSGEAIKIGCTCRITDRLKTIEREHGLPVQLTGWIYGTFATENLIHKTLAKHRLEGEWFDDCSEVRQVIDYLVSKGPYFHGLPRALIRRAA